MKAIILAAGRGSRLEELTNSNPKCLVKVFDKSLLEYQVSSLRNGGINEISVVTGYLKETIQLVNIHYFHNPNWEKTNMVMSLFEAREWLQKEECLISYSDILYPASTIEKLISHEGDFVIPYNTKWLDVWSLRFENPLSDAESFKIDNESFLTEIGNRVDSYDEIQGQYMGLLKISPNVWIKIENYLKSLEVNLRNKMDMTTLIKKLLLIGIQVKTFPIEGNWFEIDSKFDRDVYLNNPSIQIRF